MRVHELAKATQLESKQVIAIAKKHRIQIKPSPSANVEDKDIRKMMPLIEKFKSEQDAKAAEERKKKEDERQRREEERRRKDEERREATEAKRKADVSVQQKEQVDSRVDVRNRKAAERKQKEDILRAQAQEDARRRKEDDRLRSLGMPVPKRPANFRPRIAPPPPPKPRPVPRPARTEPDRAPRPPRTGDRPAGGQRQGGEFRPRPQQGQRPEGQRPDRPPRGGERPSGYQGQRSGGQQRPGGPGQQRPGGPGQQRPGGPGQQRPGGAPGQQRPGGAPGQQRPRGPQGRNAGGAGGRDTGFSGALSETNLPQIGVMRLDKPQGRRGDKERRGADKKSRGKVAPRKIFELDEDMTITSKPKNPTAPRSAFPQNNFRRPRFGANRGRRPRKAQRKPDLQNMRLRSVTVEGPITVGQFADKIGVPSTEIIRKVLLDMGLALNINAILNEDLIELIAPEYNVELEIIPVGDEYDVAEYIGDDEESTLKLRPPVVTIMGHVDHGKTSLLDHVRESKVASDEFGGITQHIGAYLVPTSKGDIVFLDTPGHEAFTSMRARGAEVTDLVILVVAADDGFMPQTIEAVNHAQAADVPIVVAINKVDLPAANPGKIKQEALQHNLVAEEFGGDTIFVEVSAKTGLNVDNLLEMIALQAEVLDLKANPNRAAQGIIIESHVDSNRGAVATVLVKRGTLRVGDHFVTGTISGRVRAMNNDRGRSIKEAGPSHPAEIIGLTGSPSAGEMMVVVPDEQVARDIAEVRDTRRRVTDLAPVANKHVTLENLHEYIEEGKTKDLNMIVKADVQGSVEAIRQSLEKITSDEIIIRILHTAVGGINESDVSLAAASDAIIIGFNVRPESSAQELANQEGVEIKTYRIIYDLIEDVKSAMIGMLSPTFKENVIGHAEVRQVFRASRLGNIAGCYVKDGEIIRDCKARLLRDNVVIYDGQLGSLRRVKEDVKRVAANTECGITILNYNDVKEGDMIEAYELEQLAPSLESVSTAD